MRTQFHDRVEAGRLLAEKLDGYDSLLDLVGDARFVLLGEASHGTHEFYRERGELNLGQLVRKRFGSQVAAQFRAAALERAIGVICRPETERVSPYFHARLPEQFDAVLHFDHTRAVEPLERGVEWQSGEVEETFPSGV